MQTLPLRLQPVVRAIRTTLGRRVFAAVVGLTALGCATLVLSSQDSARRSADATRAVAPENPAARTAGVTVSLIAPVSTPFARGIPATGTVAPRDELIIGSDAAGVRLVEVLVEVGAVVQRGQLMARGDDSLLRAELAQRDAGIRQAQAELAQAQDNLDRAERVKDSGVYSAEQLQTRRHNALAAQARLELAQAQRRELEVRIAQTRVFAPSAGVVSKKTATVGAVMQPGNELFRLIKDGQLEWLAELPAHAMAQIQPGASAKVRLDGSEPLDATVRLVAPTLDAATRNGLVHVALPKGATIKAGTHAKGEIVVAHANGIALPEAAVITRDGYPYVFVVGADSVARMKRIDTGARLRGLVEVTSGLTAGDAVVGIGAGFVKDGETVRVAPVQANDDRATAQKGA
jgi:RND family efflux transporter MFP subunit